MSKRTEAVWRMVAILWSWTLGGLIAGIITFLGFILGAVDIILQAITGWDIISESGMTFSAVAGALSWWADLHIFAFTGRGEFEWFPKLS